jgi:hypothetical protein
VSADRGGVFGGSFRLAPEPQRLLLACDAHKRPELRPQVHQKAGVRAACSSSEHGGLDVVREERTGRSGVRYQICRRLPVAHFDAALKACSEARAFWDARDIRDTMNPRGLTSS